MTNEDIIKGLTLMRKNFDSNSVYGSYCIDCLDMAIEALKAQSKHDQNTPQKQPDLGTFGVKTGETCADAISRQDAIDAVEFGITYAKVLNKENGEVMELFKKSNEELQKAVDRIEALPSAQPERKKGEWIDKSGGIEGAWNYCSVCGEQAIDLYDFCPNCGADMRGELDG